MGGGENSTGGGGSVLKEAAGREGLEGWAPCGGGVGEREGEREGLAQCGDVASVQQRPGRGACGRRAAARQWRAAGVGATRSTWLTGGPRHDGAGSSASGCGTGQHGEAVRAALTGGVGSTERPIRFSNRIKFISNGFKFAPNFDRSK
jgi:hypothetical protein